MRRFGKIFILGIIGIIVVGAVVFIFNQKMSQPTDHVWNTYENKELGFVIAYPADISKPYEAEHAKSVDGVFPGADIVQFLDSESHKVMFLWVQQTEANDIDEWFKIVYGEDGSGYIIATTTTIAGKKAIRIREEPQGKAYDSYNLHFVKEVNAYSLYIDDRILLPEDIEYITKSFHFKAWQDKIRDLF